MTTSTTSDQPIAFPAAGVYRLDPEHSSVIFRTRHLFGLGAVVGAVAVTAGEITVDPATYSATVTAILDATSLNTGNRNRDSAVHSPKFLDTERYPEIVFRAETVGRIDDRWSLPGTLTVGGVGKPLSLVIDSVESTATGFTARASARVDRYAFGITAAKGMAARHLTLVVTAAASKA